MPMGLSSTVRLVNYLIAKYLKRNFLVSACVINYLISYNVPTFNSCTIL